MFIKSGGQYYWYQNDHLGTPQKLTTTSGAVVWSAKYNSFGKASVNQGSTVVNQLRFGGQYYDEEIGIHYNRFRYFDPHTGRYLNSDPAGFFGGTNLYLYVQNSPMMLIDPYGLADFKVGGLHQLKPKLRIKIPIIDATVKNVLPNYNEAVIVSTIGGRHNIGSKHPCGEAIDIRIWDKPNVGPLDFIDKNEKGWITSEQAEELVLELREALGDEFIVRNERTHPNGQKEWGGPHIHIQLK